VANMFSWLFAAWTIHSIINYGNGFFK
jgi:hypothetical protein